MLKHTFIECLLYEILVIITLLFEYHLCPFFLSRPKFSCNAGFFIDAIYNFLWEICAVLSWSVFATGIPRQC